MLVTHKTPYYEKQNAEHKHQDNNNAKPPPYKQTTVQTNYTTMVRRKNTQQITPNLQISHMCVLEAPPEQSSKGTTDSQKSS